MTSPALGPAFLRHRLERWAHTNVLPAMLLVLLLSDVYLGSVWAFSSPVRFDSPAFSTARLLWPMCVHGVILLTAASLALLLWRLRGRCWLLGYTVACLLGGLWLFWTVLFTYAAASDPPSSLTAGAFATTALLLHLLSGIAVGHQTRK